MFDSTFHLRQLERYKDSRDKDPLYICASEIMQDHIALAAQIYNKNFDKTLNLDLGAEMLHEQLQSDYDLATSCLQLHYLNDIEGYIQRCKTLLKPGGVFIATFFGGRTLCELRAALSQAEIKLRQGVSSRIIPMIDVKDAARLLKHNGFHNVTSVIQNVEVQYADFRQMLWHPKRMGEANSLLNRDKHYFPRSLFNMAAQELDGYVSTFDFITVVAMV